MADQNATLNYTAAQINKLLTATQDIVYGKDSTLTTPIILVAKDDNNNITTTINSKNIQLNGDVINAPNGQIKTKNLTVTSNSSIGTATTNTINNTGEIKTDSATINTTATINNSVIASATIRTAEITSAEMDTIKCNKALTVTGYERVDALTGTTSTRNCAISFTDMSGNDLANVAISRATDLSAVQKSDSNENPDSALLVNPSLVVNHNLYLRNNANVLYYGGSNGSTITQSFNNADIAKVFHLSSAITLDNDNNVSNFDINNITINTATVNTATIDSLTVNNNLIGNTATINKLIINNTGTCLNVPDGEGYISLLRTYDRLLITPKPTPDDLHPDGITITASTRSITNVEELSVNTLTADSINIPAENFVSKTVQCVKDAGKTFMSFNRAQHNGKLLVVSEAMSIKLISRSDSGGTTSENIEFEVLKLADDDAEVSIFDVNQNTGSKSILCLGSTNSSGLGGVQTVKIPNKFGIVGVKGIVVDDEYYWLVTGNVTPVNT